MPVKVQIMKGGCPSGPSHILNIRKTQILIISWKNIRSHSPSSSSTCEVATELSGMAKRL